MLLKRLLNLKSTNVWYLASAIAMNFFWTLGLAVFLSILLLNDIRSSTVLMQAGLVLVSFLLPFLIAWIIGSIAADGRGPTYGIYGGIAAAVVLFILAVPSTGLLGVMMVIVALAGGFNGGMLTVRPVIKK